MELVGEGGTVVRVKHYPAGAEGPWWEVAVAYDALPVRPAFYHEPEDLVAAGHA